MFFIWWCKIFALYLYCINQITNIMKRDLLELEMVLTFLGFEFIDYNGQRTSNGHNTIKIIGHLKEFFGKEIMTSGQFIKDINWFDFETNWNDLMFLVANIENLKDKDNFILYDVTIFSDAVLIADQQGNEIVLINKSDNGEFTTKIEAVYLACVKFIKWYNEQPKQ